MTKPEPTNIPLRIAFSCVFWVYLCLYISLSVSFYLSLLLVVPRCFRLSVCFFVCLFVCWIVCDFLLLSSTGCSLSIHIQNFVYCLVCSVFSLELVSLLGVWPSFMFWELFV